MNEMLPEAPREERFLVPKRDDLPNRLPNLLVTPLGEYVPRDWDGYNTSGLVPTGDNVLLLPDQPLERSSGGVWLLDEYVERIAAAAESGTIIAIGDGAWFWNQDRTRRYDGMKYKIADRCRFTRYAGQLHHGLDGVIYRIVSDKEIGGLAIPLPDTHEFYWEERKLPDGSELKPIRRVRMKSLDAIAAPAEAKAIEDFSAVNPPKDVATEQSEAQAWLDEQMTEVNKRWNAVNGQPTAMTRGGIPYVVLAVGGIKEQGRAPDPIYSQDSAIEAARRILSEIHTFCGMSTKGTRLHWRRRPQIMWYFDTGMWQATCRLAMSAEEVEEAAHV